jgi:hypothetical protein
MGKAQVVFRRLVLESPHGLGEKQQLVSMIYFDLHAPGASYIGLRADVERVGRVYEVTKPRTYAVLFDDPDAFVALAQTYLRRALGRRSASRNVIEDSWATELGIALRAVDP